jgi:hypothetical protein
MEEDTYIIEGEIAEEYLHLSSVTTIQIMDNQVRSVAEEVKEMEARDEAMMDLGVTVVVIGVEVEGHPILGSSTTLDTP